MADLTPQQNEFYSSMEGTFRTAGWDLLVTGWKQERDQLPENVFFNAQSLEDIRAARVRYKLLEEMITLPETLEQQKINVVNDNDGPGEYV